MKGATYKRCGCRNPESGKPWGHSCPKLKRRNGSWNPDHGVWHLQAELPARTDGTRRLLRKGGYATQTDANAELDRVRTLLALAEPHDNPVLTTIADALETAHRDKEPLPSQEEIKRHIHTGIAATDLPTVGDYLTDWLTGRRKIAASTRRSSNTHIRLYLIPHLGTIRLDKLRRHHIVSLFDSIDERNDTIRTARASADPKIRRTVRGMRATGPATQQRIRATLRVALNNAISAAASCPPTPAPRPKTPPTSSPATHTTKDPSSNSRPGKTSPYSIDACSRSEELCCHNSSS